MKRITLSLFAVLVFGVLSAQETAVDFFANNSDFTFTQGEATIISNSGSRDIVQTYSDRVTFQTEVPGASILEDFGGGPADISVCGVPISSAGEACFAAGEIVDGYEGNIGGGTGIDNVYVPGGSAFGNAQPIVGANTFIDFTIIDLTDGVTTAVGFDLYSLITGSDVEIRVMGAGGMIDSFTVNSPATEVFFGVFADELITSIELEDFSGANAELIGNLLFGEQLSVGSNELSQVSVYPNPATNVVNIKAPASVQIQSVSIFDVLGKETVANVVNGQVNVSNLSSGVYIMNIRTNQGVLTEKIVKR